MDLFDWSFKKKNLTTHTMDIPTKKKELCSPFLWLRYVSYVQGKAKF
jgi:hypothetical protein